MTETEKDLQQAIDKVGQISIVPTLLDMICKTTGMGFSAIARVTDDRWITCSVKDQLEFGLKPGDELEIKNTFCQVVRSQQSSVLIDNVAEDPDYCDHFIPKMFGFQSYISVPIVQNDGSFFGTLCALDPKPNSVKNDSIQSMFRMFADLIAFHLDTLEKVKQKENKFTEEQTFLMETLQDQKSFATDLERKIMERNQELTLKNIELEKMNNELQSLTRISSHDLQEPLRKIQTYSSLLQSKESAALSEKGHRYFEIIRKSAGRMRALINDILTYSGTREGQLHVSPLSLEDLVGEVKEELKEELEEKNAELIISENCTLEVDEDQFKQLLYNLLSNSLKYSSPERKLKIELGCSEVGELPDGIATPKQAPAYWNFYIADNGIGFDQQYSEQIFGLFQRLHNKSTYPGTGTGLAIAKRIVENHEGIVRAVSQPDEGTRVEIFLPANMPD